jgi:hypothetical protein
VDADLLDASSWTMSNKLRFDPEWVPESWGRLEAPGWLEGNVIEAPDGSIVNILRFNSIPLVDKAAVIRVDDDGKAISFDPATGFIDFPGGMSKFTIRRDAATKQYITLTNNNTDPDYPNQRNVLSLYSSFDLMKWEHRLTLLEDDSELEYADSMQLTGFQYVDWQFDADDIIFLSRTAYDGAHTFHDANRVTFHVIRDYRRFTQIREG